MLTRKGHVYVGTTFAHAHQITGSPKAGTAKPAVCRITKITKLMVYFRNESGYLSKVAPEKLADAMLYIIQHREGFNGHDTIPSRVSVASYPVRLS